MSQKKKDQAENNKDNLTNDSTGSAHSASPSATSPSTVSSGQSNRSGPSGSGQASSPQLGSVQAGSGQGKLADEDQDLEKLKRDFEQLKAKSEELANQLKRAVADYHNLEKRVAEGRSELSGWVTGELIQKILVPLDHIEKAISGASEEERKTGWFKGVEMSVKQLQQVLRDEGLEQIAADGQFDPILHEAVDTREPTDAEAKAGRGKEGEILEVAEKGYNLNGKILRPAKVVVGTSRRHSERSEESKE